MMRWRGQFVTKRSFSQISLAKLMNARAFVFFSTVFGATSTGSDTAF